MKLRLQYAELLRHFMSGRMTNDEYEDAYEKLGHDDENEFWCIFVAAWHLYDDLHEHRMTRKDGHKLSPEMRRRVARWILFLRSNAAISVPETVIVTRSSILAMCRPALWGAWLISLSAVLAVSLGVWWAIALLAAWGALAIPVRQHLRTCSPSLSAVAAHVFTDDPNDPWPFMSQADLAKAIAQPTYLHGRISVSS